MGRGKIMDSILVGIIVAAAVFFSVRSFIRTYKGQGVV